MANTKIKLTTLLEFLRQETDMDHPATTNQIIKRMVEQGVSCDRKTLARDVALLNERGYEVMKTRVGHENAYYVEDRDFDVAELKLLIDAVQAASFVTEKKTEALVKKIAQLGGSHQAEILNGNLVRFNTRKHSNEQIYFNIFAIEEAIQKQCKAIFLYYDLNENKEKIYRRDGHHYVIEPIALVFLEDNYYVLSYDSRYDKVTTYRVDRMERIETKEDEPISEQAKEKINVGEYTEQTFKMYNGELKDITLEFDDKLITSVYDKFGEGIQMIRTGEHTCVASVKVRISPTFWGWLFQFVGEMKILTPTYLAYEYARLAEKIHEDLFEIKYDAKEATESVV